MKVSDYIAAFLHKQKINVVFEMAGGMITHMLDSIAKYDDIKIVSVHHEQAASFAADAFGRVTGRPGVAMATSGPGATNLLTGIGSCYFDSSPAIFITGQVNTHEQKGDRNIRQLGFQETDIATMAVPVTKAVYRVTDSKQIPAIFNEAFKIALSGRPGPVLIDIPMNIQRENIEVEDISFITAENDPNAFSLAQAQEILSLLKQAKRPLIIAGGGIRASQTSALFQQFVDTFKIPVITSLMGVDLLAYEHPQRVGFWGSYGNRWANLAIGSADLLLVLGSRLDIRQTGADTNFFNTKTIIHVDCEEGEINNRLKNCVKVVTDLEPFFTLMQQQEAQAISVEWANELTALKQTWPDTKELPAAKGINPNVFMHQLSTVSKDVYAWVADVGNHQMWAAQSLELKADERFLTSGGMGAMGFALPAAIGATLGSGKTSVVIAGDGGFQLNIQELQTIIHNKLPVKMVIMNNQNLGMIRQFQDSYFESRYQSTLWGYSAPDFTKIANAYNIEAVTITDISETENALKWLFADDSPKLLQVMVDTYTNAYPKIAFGKPITEMEPFSKPIDMEGT